MGAAVEEAVPVGATRLEFEKHLGCLLRDRCGRASRAIHRKRPLVCSYMDFSCECSRACTRWNWMCRRESCLRWYIRGSGVRYGVLRQEEGLSSGAFRRG